MIEQLNAPPACRVFREDAPDLCLGHNLLNPLASHDIFRHNAWYPFQDFYFSEEMVGTICENSGASLYRQSMLCRASQPEYYRITGAAKLDLRIIMDWLSYDEGIIWAENGMVIINSFSDLAVLAIGDDLSRLAFGATIRDLFERSSSAFTRETADVEINKYLSLIKTTWVHEG